MISSLTSISPTSTTCSLLDLPVELRLQIYSYTFLPTTITISSTPLRSGDCVPRGSPVPGLSYARKIIAGEGHQPELLKKEHEGDYEHGSSSESQPPVYQAQELAEMLRNSEGTAHQGSALLMAARFLSWEDSNDIAKWEIAKGTERRCNSARTKIPSQDTPSFILHDNIGALHRTCRTIRSDLNRHMHSENSRFKHSPERPLNLYLSYPSGVCFVTHRYRHLLRMVGNIHISGISELNEVEMSSDYLLVKQRLKALETMVSILLGKRGGRVSPSDFSGKDTLVSVSRPRLPAAFSAPATRASPILHVRLFHPQMSPPDVITIHPQSPMTDPYELLWRSKYSPAPVVLRFIYGGAIVLTTLRSRRPSRPGAGVDILARANSEPSREVTSRHLTPGQLGTGWEVDSWLTTGWQDDDDED